MADNSSGRVTDSSPETSRRGLLKWLGAGGAAALATVVTAKEAQAGHDGTNVFHLGEANTNPAGTETALRANGEHHALVLEGDSGGSQHQPKALQVENGVANFSATEDGHAFFFANEHPERGGCIFADGRGKPVIEGFGVPSASFPDSGEPGTGVAGVAALEPGGEGLGPGVGVSGMSGTGTGVDGVSNTGIGVHARTNTSEGIALAVSGRSRFGTAGSAVIPAGQSSVFVENQAVTGDSHISVTLVSDPGRRELGWVERSPGSGFTVHLTDAPPPRRPETSLTYLIIEPS